MLGRLGRVTHWALLVYAALAALVAFLTLQSGSRIDVTAPLVGDGGGWESAQEIADWHWEQGTKWLFHALAAFLAGRAARYVLSAE